MTVTRFFHPVMPAWRLRTRPKRVLIAGRPFVLWRDDTGRAAAFADACPHRKAPLSAGFVKHGRLTCRYHGWNFDAEGHGRSPSQPALKKCDASRMQLVQRSGYLWLADPEASESSFPQLAWDGFEPAGSFAMRFEAPLHVALDNFSEDEHTPWVHTRLGWDHQDAGNIEFSAQNFPDRTEVVYRARQRTSLARYLIGMKDGDIFHNEWETRFDPVRTIYTIYWTDPSRAQRRGMTVRAAIFMVPETDRSTWFHVLINARIESRAMRVFAPVVKKAAVALAWAEIRDDAKFIPTVADTPEDMKGMRLGKYDKPLVHNHKLLRTLYWGEDDKIRTIGTAARR